MLFIDDFSRKTCVYFLKEKFEVFTAFKKFRALVEKESGYFIKAMRYDKGGEFTSKEFKEYYEDHGIHRSLTVPYSSQQNGIVERKNRSVLDMARSTLKTKKILAELWVEVVDCAVYLLNCSPSQSAWNKARYSKLKSIWKPCICSCA